MFGGSKLCSLNLRITSLEEEVSFELEKNGTGIFKGKPLGNCEGVTGKGELRSGRKAQLTGVHVGNSVGSPERWQKTRGRKNFPTPQFYLVAGPGFEPGTFGL